MSLDLSTIPVSGTRDVAVRDATLRVVLMWLRTSNYPVPRTSEGLTVELVDTMQKAGIPTLDVAPDTTEAINPS
jgi:hypothetical protein